MKTYKKHIERNDLRDATHLEVSVYYNKGGPNFSYGGTTPRGYYLAVRPVTRGNNTVSYALFSGKSRFLFGTKRYTAKQFERAMEMAKGYEDELTAAVVAENKAA
ncbi:MAG: hypothetical protein FWG87_01615 [Defluviitaleaceae bacterium]|nr:hypothetical protein [Defluviitaleaceae bacterium]